MPPVRKLTRPRFSRYLGIYARLLGARLACRKSTTDTAVWNRRLFALVDSPTGALFAATAAAAVGIALAPLVVSARHVPYTIYHRPDGRLLYVRVDAAAAWDIVNPPPLYRSSMAAAMLSAMSRSTASSVWNGVAPSIRSTGTPSNARPLPNTARCCSSSASA
jgi:hypothetical protein